MKKSLILFAAAPLLCAGLGFGAGTVLKPKAVSLPAKPHAEAAAAAGVLDGLADETPGHAAPEADAHAPQAPLPHQPAPAEDSHAAKLPQPDAAHEPSHAPEPAAHETAEAGPEPEPAKGGHASGHGPIVDAVEDTRIVQVGRISVPVYKPKSVTYVIADFGVAVENQDDVAYYSIAENATRLRDAILTSMHKAAETPMLYGPAINSDELAEAVATDLKPAFEGVKDVLFLSLHKADVPRS